MTNAVLTGLVLGGMYALIAMGLTLQYGVARIMNLSYGEFLIGAAFASYWLFTGWALNPLAGLAFVIPVSFGISYLLYRVLLTPLVRRARTRDALEVYLTLTRTRIGTSIRAVAVDPIAAQLVAIDVTRTSALAFALGGALVASAGVLISMFLTFSATSGVVFTMKALIVVVMGGVGNLLGCLVAGLALGLSEALVATFIDPGLTLAVNFALFLGVLLVKPAGIFGRAQR
jgi:branched-chain amino acid transport system permease protein